jgi:hypothetical protein
MCRNTIGDPSGATTQRWTDAEIEGYANRAQYQVVLDTEVSLEAVFTIALVESQSEYELPTSFIRDKHVEYEASTTDIRRLTYLTHDEYNRSHSRNPTTESEPIYYWYWNKVGTDPALIQPTSIHIVPTPNATAAAATGIRIYGYKYPNQLDLTSPSPDDALQLPMPYSEAIVLKVAEFVKLDDDDMPGAERIEAKYQRQISKILDFQSHKTRSEISRIKPRSSVFTGIFSRRYHGAPDIWGRGY